MPRKRDRIDLVKEMEKRGRLVHVLRNFRHAQQENVFDMVLNEDINWEDPSMKEDFAKQLSEIIEKIIDKNPKSSDYITAANLLMLMWNLDNPY